MNEFISVLKSEFIQQSNPNIALKQKAYMRDQFDFFGIKTTERRVIQKPFLAKEFLPKKQEIHPIIKELWSQPQRDFQLFGQELLFKYCKNFEEQDIELLEYMVLNKSWWDTVDFIACKLMAAFFKIFPEKKREYVEKWLQSENIWLQRSALIFQLKYKEEIDTEILSLGINYLLGSKEFFINKAIGWILREYSRTNPIWVIEFVSKTALAPLSKKEALRLL